MTGHSEVQKKRPPPQSWVPPQSSLTRPAQLFETSIPGIFAIGDVRRVSIERQARVPPVSITCIRRFAPPRSLVRELGQDISVDLRRLRFRARTLRKFRRLVLRSADDKME